MKWCVIFFFKQKTAYEIKECDWSSDVCSSDLMATKPKSPGKFGFEFGFGMPFIPVKFPGMGGIPQIGRASCRERV